MDQEGKFERSDVMDKLAVVDQLILSLEDEIPRESGASDFECTSQYQSVIRFDGIPILPPVMTKARREEMQFYKHQAMMKEAKLKSVSHRKLLETVQQVIERLDVKKKKDDGIDMENSKQEERQKVPPDKERDYNISQRQDEGPHCIRIPAKSFAHTHVPLDNNLQEETASPRSAVGDSGISSDLQQMTSPRLAQLSTLETVDTLAEITDMSTDLESDVAGETGVNDNVTVDTKCGVEVQEDTVSVSDSRTTLGETSAEIEKEIDLTSTRTDSLSGDSESSLRGEESQNNVHDTNDNTLKADVSSTKNSDSSQASSDTMSVTVISRGGQDPPKDHSLVKGGHTAECDSVNQQDLHEEPEIIEIDTPPAAATLSQHSQTEDQDSLLDSLESTDEPQGEHEEQELASVDSEKVEKPAPDTEDEEKPAPLADSLELGSTLLSRVALSDNEDSSDSTLDDQSDVAHQSKSDINEPENVSNTRGVVEGDISITTVKSKGLTDVVTANESKSETKSERKLSAIGQTEFKEPATGTELFPGQTQKLMVLQKLNTLLEQVESKTTAMKPKSILRTPEKYKVTPAEAASPGPDHTPDVSVISYADSYVSANNQRNYEDESPALSSGVMPQSATSPHLKTGVSPPSATRGGELKSLDTSVVHTASTELGRYMAESVNSMDTINSVSTLPHTGVTNAKELLHEVTEVPPKKKTTPAAPESSGRSNSNGTAKTHRRQGSYTLEKPSPALLQSAKQDESNKQNCPTDPGCTSSMEDLKLRPVHRKLCYDKENTPPKSSESRMKEKSAKEEHLQRYLQQLGQMPSPAEPPPATTPPALQLTEADLLQDQIKYFGQMKDHMMLLHQQQLAQLLTEQQRHQLLLQQQFLQQEQQLRQQLSMTLGGCEGQMSRSSLTPEIPAMPMTLPMFSMLPTTPIDMAASMASFTHPAAPNLAGNSSFMSTNNQVSHIYNSQCMPRNPAHDSVLSAKDHVSPMNYSHHRVVPDLADNSMQLTSQSQPVTNTSPHVCFSTNATATPAQLIAPEVQVHYYTPEHSSPPSPEVTTVVRRPVTSLSPGSPVRLRSASHSPETRRLFEMNLESLSDDILHKFNRVTAAARGYLTRRLLKTQKVQQVITTIRDTAIFALNFQSETPIKQGVYSSQDIRLQDRVLSQLTAAMYEINEIFVQIPIKERMAIIAQDRELLREKRFKEQRRSAEKKVSAATKKAMERKKRAKLAEKSMLEQSFRPKSAPPSARSPRSSQSRQEDISGPIKRNYQFMISRAMPKSSRSRRSGSSPLKPVKDNINRSVLEYSKSKKDTISNRKTNTNTKRTNSKQDVIVRKTVTLSSKEVSNEKGNEKKKESTAKHHHGFNKNASVPSRLNNATVKQTQGHVPDASTPSHGPMQKSKMNTTTPWK